MEHSFNDPAQAQTAAQPFGGRRLGAGRFTVLRQIGRGGMGSVWLARDTVDGSPVALKFLPQAVSDDAAGLANLRRESRHAGRLEHPHIVRPRELHEHPGEAPFLAMEYVDGPTLNQLRAEAKDGLLAWKFLAPLAAQLCEALACAHAARVIHRDLKPANLMLDSAGRLKLTDFGIAATITDTMTRITGAAFASGTTAYMSPQQVNGELPRATDDIYSAGATLFELLTGTPPFFSGELVHQVLNKPAPTLKQRLAELEKSNAVPKHVEEALLACLDKNPAHRPQSAAELAAWLRAGEAAVPVPWPASRRRAAAGVAVAVVIVAGFLWQASKPRETPSPVGPPPGATSVASVSASSPVSSILPAGTLLAESFDAVDESGLPPGWFCAAYARSVEGRGPAMEVVREADGPYLRCRMTVAREPAFVARLVDVPPSVVLRVSARLRVSPLEIAPQFTGAGAMVRCVWVLEDGRRVKAGGSSAILLRAATTGWERHEFDISPPEPPARQLVIEAGLAGAVGTAELDDLAISTPAPAPPPTPVPPRVREIFSDDFERGATGPLIPNWQSDRVSQSPDSRGKLVIAAGGGNKFLRITTTRESPNAIQVFRVLPREKNTLMEVSARVRVTSTFTNGLRAGQVFRFMFLDLSGNYLSEFVPSGGTVRLGSGGEWTRVSFRIVPPGNSASMRLHLAVPPGIGTVDFDNVRVAKVE